MATSANLLFYGTQDDHAYLHQLKSVCKHVGSTYVVLEKLDTLAFLRVYCEKRGVSGIITTRPELLLKLDPTILAKEANLANFAGSHFTLPDSNIQIVFISPLKQLISVSYGKFLTSRYISKLTAPEVWVDMPEFSWEIAEPATVTKLYAKFATAMLIAVDIETVRDPLRITCVGYCGIFYSQTTKQFTCHTVVIKVEDMFMLGWVRKFNALQAPKVTQNGKYDLAYLSRYRAPLTNWLLDTATAMHSYYCELPKDLAAIAAFFVRTARYWKYESKTGSINSYEYLLYNAHDCHNTACAILGWLAEAPEWAVTNYKLEFPVNIPCHLAEMTGLKVDLDKFRENKRNQEGIIESTGNSLNRMLGLATGEAFNTNSPQQVKRLLAVLGCSDIASTEEKELKKCADRHPLNRVIIEAILRIRKARKLVSTYLVEDKLFDGEVMLFAFNPHGTDTARLTSKEHHFWCGFNGQNMPRGPEVKSAVVPYRGFKLYEADYAQAESRGTGYVTGELNLITAVESGKDFHSINAQAFFGVPYAEIYDDAKGKTINKALRDLSKRTNHGANYNMGPAVMLDTMGAANVIRARTLLGLPKFMTLIKVCEHLLTCFGAAYPKVRCNYPEWIVRTIAASEKLVSALGWTRHCFGNPAKSKLDLNSYIAHVPQNLNAGILNKAWLNVFYNVWLPNQDNFKLCAQIHDSILFQVREGYEHLALEVKANMEFPVEVTDIDGTTRSMLVPVDLKVGLDSWYSND